MKMRKFTTFALAAALAIGTFGTSVPAKADDNSTDYTLTIPATLTVEQVGWNATDGITAQVKRGETFDTSKKLTVTATSTNNWALKSGQNTIGYNLATATGTYSSSATPASWEFSATELNETNGTNKAMGIIVEDYSSKPAGSYTDTVTFTASVANAAPTYADKLIQCNGALGNCVTDNNGSGDAQFTGKTITAAEAIALAQYMNKNNDGKECAVFYGLSGSKVCFGKSDGTTGSGDYYFDDVDLGISGYNLYYVSNN